MRISLPLLCLLFAIVLCASCSSSREARRPEVYRGGQYYGDALHANDFKPTEDHTRQAMRN